MSKKVFFEVKKLAQALSEGKSHLQIAKEFGISKGSVSNFKKRLKDCGLNEEALESKSQEELFLLIYAKQNPRVEPQWDEIEDLYKASKHATLSLMYEQYREENPDGYSLSSWYRHYHQNKNSEQQAKLRLEREPADRLEIDYSGDVLAWQDGMGVLHRAHMFVAALPYSGLVFAIATEDEKRRSWIIGINATLEYLGGVPKVLVFDNSKALVVKPRRRTAKGIDDAEVAEELKLLGDHYGMQLYACDIRSPQAKDRVEASVRVVQTRVMAPLCLNKGYVQAHDLADLNAKIRVAVNRLNDRPLSKQAGLTRRKIFELEEKPLLSLLPERSFSSYEWRMLKVDKDCCIRLNDGHRYSVPKQYKGSVVIVGCNQSDVQIYRDGQNSSLICKHQRVTSKVGPKTHLLPEHLTAKEKSNRAGPEQFLRWFTSQGLDEKLSRQFIDRCWEGSHFRARKTLNMAYELIQKHSVSVVNRAIGLCLSNDLCTYTQLKKRTEYAEEEKRRQPQLNLGLSESYQNVTHENIRNDYE